MHEDEQGMLSQIEEVDCLKESLRVLILHKQVSFLWFFSLLLFFGGEKSGAQRSESDKNWVKR